MNRAARRRNASYWKAMVTRGELAGLLDRYDETAVLPARALVDVLMQWHALPIWKRAWLRIRGQHPFMSVGSLVEDAKNVAVEEPEPPPED